MRFKAKLLKRFMPIFTSHLDKLRNTICLWSKYQKNIASWAQNYSRKWQKKDDPKQERMFGRFSKMPIANKFRELVEMDFVDYGDYAAFLHIRYTFRDFP